MSKKSTLIFVLALFCISTISAQQRYLDSVFTAINFTSDIQYGSNIDYNGVNQNLLLNLYQPDGDTLAERPLIICMHGGGFTSGSKDDLSLLRTLNGYTLRGYVVASIDYRLGINHGAVGNNEALYRAVQDAKAAIRFFKRYKDVYKIDTSMIVISGESAGSHAAIHTAFWDASEVPSNIDTVALGNLEGNSGNPGYSSSVAAIMNYWGAIRDTTWMQADEPMIVSIHGIDDSNVSIYESQNQQGDYTQYGSAIIDRVADRIGLAHALRLFADANHGLVGSNPSDVIYRLDTALLFTAEFLYCNMIIKCADTISYCTSTGIDSKTEYINSVTIGSTVNNSGNNNGYGDFTTSPISVSSGKTINFKLNAGFSGASKKEYVCVWIDFNQDGDFDDSGEEVVKKTLIGKFPLTKSISIPSTANVGNIRLRVSMKNGAYPTSCEVFSKGEVEDYTLTISSSAKTDVSSGLSDIVIGNPDFTIYPNPATDNITIVINNAIHNEYTLSIYDLLGKKILTKTFSIATESSTFHLNLQNLNTGSYVVCLYDNEHALVSKQLLLKE